MCITRKTFCSIRDATRLEVAFLGHRGHQRSRYISKAIYDDILSRILSGGGDVDISPDGGTQRPESNFAYWQRPFKSYGDDFDEGEMLMTKRDVKAAPKLDNQLQVRTII